MFATLDGKTIGNTQIVSTFDALNAIDIQDEYNIVSGGDLIYVPTSSDTYRLAYEFYDVDGRPYYVDCELGITLDVFCD